MSVSWNVHTYPIGCAALLQDLESRREKEYAISKLSLA
jgi:hypothetical protein